MRKRAVPACIDTWQLETMNVFSCKQETAYHSNNCMLLAMFAELGSDAQYVICASLYRLNNCFLSRNVLLGNCFLSFQWVLRWLLCGQLEIFANASVVKFLSLEPVFQHVNVRREGSCHVTLGDR